ncbi:MAG: hypothetical protein CL908_15480 [Deltaproteobacteria bacterium]|nr:hypothetical protein [Deltaproteobacteria bacterium]
MRLSCLLVLVLASSVPAQFGLSGVVSPAVVSPGQTVSITVTAIQQISLPSPCVWQMVRANSPTGPTVPQFIFCITVITPLAPGQSQTGTWSVGNVAPGTYWFQVGWFSPLGASLQNEFFCFEVRAPGSQDPTLTATTVARLGQTLSMDVAAPLLPGAPYIGAMSLTSNNPIPLGANGPWTCIDNDLVFQLSFPAPLPGLFLNLVGTTDANGNATGIGINVPNLPALTWFPLKAHVAVLSPMTLTPTLTNGLAFTIQP